MATFGEIPIKLILLIIGLVLINNFSYSKQNLSIVVSGEIKGLPDNVKLSLIKGDNMNPEDTIQATISKNGKFTFKNIELIAGKFYFIILDTTVFKFPKQRKNWIRFIAEPNEISLQGTINNWPKVDFSGTNETRIYEEYHIQNGKHVKEFNASDKELRSLLPDNLKFKNYKDLLDLMQNDTSSSFIKFKLATEQWKRFVKEYVKANSTSSITPLLITKSNVLNLEDKNEAYNALPTKTKMSFYGMQLKDYLAKEKLGRTIGLGKEIPDFNLLTPEGKVVKLKELVRQNKLTLIDFWASWCGPCRAAIPHLKEVYSQFKNQGFSIVGVSSDNNEKAWKKAIVDDGTPWNQGLSVDGNANALFQIQGIPSYILLDGTGKIVASNIVDMGKGLGTQGPSIRGEQLSKTLESLLGGK